MKNMSFNEKLIKISKKNNSLVCVGLDIDKDKMPNHLFTNNKTPFIDFNKKIIENTQDFVCAYKLNLAFYEVIGENGYNILKETIKNIPKEIVIILDGKRNDIGNTAKKYAHSLYQDLKADAITVNPYLGWNGIEPFLQYKNKCSFILCRTSNPSAVDFQNLESQNKPIFMYVAEKINEWNKIGACGAVIGATYPDELKRIRKTLSENIPLLIPGIGKQGGDIEKTVKYGTNSKNELAIINSSRGIIYASSGKNFAEDAGKETEKLKEKINECR